MFRVVFLACAGASLVASATMIASPQITTPSEPPAAASGKEIVQRKCFQCHPVTMWSSVRGDRKEWLGVLYRMVGRGALWTEDEIDAMADFLAQTRGPK
jgi:hypothetical protein